MSFYTPNSPGSKMAEKHESNREPLRKPKHKSFFSGMGKRLSFSFLTRKLGKHQKPTNDQVSSTDNVLHEPHKPSNISVPNAPIPGASRMSGIRETVIPTRPPYPSAFQGELYTKLRERLGSTYQSSPLPVESVTGVTPISEKVSSTQDTSPNLTGMQHKLAVGRQRNRRPPTRGTPNKSALPKELTETINDLDDEGCVAFFSNPSTMSTPFTSSNLESISEELVDTQVLPKLPVTSSTTPLLGHANAPARPPQPKLTSMIPTEPTSGPDKPWLLNLEPRQGRLSGAKLSLNAQLPSLSNEEDEGEVSRTQSSTEGQSGRLRSLSSSERGDSPGEVSPLLSKSCSPGSSKRPMSMCHTSSVGHSPSPITRHLPTTAKWAAAGDEESSLSSASDVKPVMRSPPGIRYSIPTSHAALKSVNGICHDTSDDLGPVSARASVFGAHLHSPKPSIDSLRIRPKPKEATNSSSEVSPEPGKRSSRVFDLVKNFEGGL